MTYRFLGLCLLLLPCALPAQEGKKIKFQKISLEQGLSQITGYTIVQDHKDFIWIGTQDGLNRYDGYEFRIYKNDEINPKTISDNHIRVVYQSPDNSLWIGTEAGGLNLYDRGADSFSSFKPDKNDPQSLSHIHVSSILKDTDGNLWVGTSGGGLNLMKKGQNKFQRFQTKADEPNSLSSDTVTAIYQTTKGALWIGTSNGLDYFEPATKSFIRYYHTSDTHSLSDNRVECIYEDRKNRLWVGTEDGLNMAQAGGGYFEVFRHDPARSNSLSNNHIKVINEDSEGNIWVGTELGGLNLFNPLKNESQSFKIGATAWNTISNNSIRSIMQDKTGVLWIGTYGGGINKADLGQIKFKLYENVPDDGQSLSSNIVWRIHEAKNGEVWLATNKGLSVMDPKTGLFQNFYHDPKKPKSLGSDQVKAVFEDSRGRIWVGTVGGGLDRLIDRQKGEFEHFRHNPADTTSLSSDFIQSIYEDKEKNIWIGTIKAGASRFIEKEQKFYRYPHDKNKPGSLSHERVNSFFEDSDGDFWVGTSGGLNLLDKRKGTFKQYVKIQGDTNAMRHSYVGGIAQDEHGRIWMVSYGGGIHCLHKKTWKFSHIGEKDGLPTNGTSGIIIDKYEKLWISTVKGFCKYDPETKTFKYFDENDGLQGKGFNVGAFHHGASGTFYYGGINGFNAFNPDSIRENPHLPKVVFTGFKIFNKEVSPAPDGVLKKEISETDNITLSYKDYVFTINFAGLHYTNSELNRYAYMMEGFDPDWVYSKDIRFATYTNLPPGTYSFKVKSANSDGRWCEPASLQITVTPPFWESLWFRLLAGALLLGGGALWYRSNVNSMKLQKARLETLVEARTAEIFSKTRELEQQKEEILSQRDDIEKKSHILESQKDEIEQQKEDLLKTNKSIQIISDIGQKITSTLDLDKIINLVYDSVNDLMDATEFGIGIYVAEKKLIDYKLYIYMSQKMKDLVVSVDSDAERFAIICVKQKKEIFIKDMSKEYSLYLSSLKDYDEGDLLESMICLPLVVEERVVGIISVQSPLKNAYTEAHLNMMKTLANYAGIALDNSKAYTRLQEVNDLVESKNKHILDSIRYAETIQHAFLPSEQALTKAFREHFVLYKPKDVVSGDFYWFAESGGYVFAAVVDCTGHGVPGAFMSLVGNNALNLIVREKKIYSPADILLELDHEVRKSFSRDNDKNDDGMDIGLCRIDKTKREILYAAAKRPLFVFAENGDITAVRGDKMSIGGAQKKADAAFTNQKVPYDEKSSYYLSSDGYVDQCDADRNKIGTLAFHLNIKKNISISLPEQGRHLEQFLSDFVGAAEQRDDITLLGFRL